MRRITLLFLILVTTGAVGQDHSSPSLFNVDSIVDTIHLDGYPEPADIAWLLAEPFNSDSLKVRAFYYWITKHISYDYKAFLDKSSLTYDPAKDADMDAYYFRRIYRTLHTKKGVCFDFALVFGFFCKTVQIPCNVVEGYGLDVKSKSSLTFCWNSINRNHAWNVVEINNKWYLLDATWGSGYIDLETAHFVKERNDFYYLTPPDYFILEHYPVNSCWQLMTPEWDVTTFIERAMYKRK